MFTGIRKFGDKVGDKFGETLRKGRTSEFAPEVEEEKRVFGNALKRNHDDIPVILRKVVEFFDEKGALSEATTSVLAVFRVVRALSVCKGSCERDRHQCSSAAGVEIEGLFRISGAQSQMLALKEQFERGARVAITKFVDYWEEPWGRRERERERR